MSDQQRIIITGGAGFIGSRLVPMLVAKGRHCLILDNLSVGLPPPVVRDGVDFLYRDICDIQAVARDVRAFSPDCVIHLAAIHHIPTCEKDAPRALQVNVVGTQSVLDAAERAGVRRIIIASSGAVYDWKDGALNEDTTPVRPHDVYATSKLTNEYQLALAAARGKVTGIIARIFNTVGPGDPNAHLIPDIARQLNVEGEEITIALGNTHTRRDYIYVEDTAACLAAMVDVHLDGGVHTFNVGTGTDRSVEELVRELASILHKRCTISVDPSRVRKVDRLSQLADNSKAVATLGWQPRVSFTQALRLAINHEPLRSQTS